jgi:hypothetical protein
LGLSLSQSGCCARPRFPAKNNSNNLTGRVGANPNRNGTIISL